MAEQVALLHLLLLRGAGTHKLRVGPEQAARSQEQALVAAQAAQAEALATIMAAAAVARLGTPAMVAAAAAVTLAGVMALQVPAAVLAAAAAVAIIWLAVVTLPKLLAHRVAGWGFLARAVMARGVLFVQVVIQQLRAAVDRGVRPLIGVATL